MALTSFVFVQLKRRLLHKHFARKKCFSYVIQRQTTFSLYNNPPSMRNCKSLVVIITERLHLIQRRSNMAVKLTRNEHHYCHGNIWLTSTKTFWKWEKIFEGHVWLVTAIIWTEFLFIQEVSGIYTSLFLDTDQLKMALRAWKVSGAFEKPAPGLGCSNTHRGAPKICILQNQQEKGGASKKLNR